MNSNQKDIILKITNDDLKIKSSVLIPNMGVINYNGDINWDCPCLGGLPYSKCGKQFRDAFSCFYYLPQDQRGVGCVDYFDNLFNCFQEYPELLPKKSEENDISSSFNTQQSNMTLLDNDSDNDKIL